MLDNVRCQAFRTVWRGRRRTRWTTAAGAALPISASLGAQGRPGAVGLRGKFLKLGVAVRLMFRGALVPEIGPVPIGPQPINVSDGGRRKDGSRVIVQSPVERWACSGGTVASGTGGSIRFSTPSRHR